MIRIFFIAVVAFATLSTSAWAGSRFSSDGPNLGESEMTGELEPIERDEEEEESCCDKCFAASVAAGNNVAGAVCCCSDDTGDVVPEACSFADKFPDAWPAGKGQDVLDACIHVHEQGHIDDREGVCTDIPAGNPSVWGPGQDSDTCEPNQFEQEVDCLEDSDCDDDPECENLVKKRISTLESIYNVSACGEHCVSP